jgi:chemotaxis protein methyltransferase CheR
MPNSDARHDRRDPTGERAMSAAPAAVTMGQDRLSPADFARVAKFVRSRTGIKMPEGKATMLEGRLRRRVRATGMPTLAAYCRHVFTDDHLDEEGGHLINAVTTNKTDFFREPRHFDYLTNVALPALADKGVRPLRVWSAGCSTGAEPYTLAMLLQEFADRGGPSYGILATDIDTEVLETARRGIYPADMARPVPAALRQRYMLAARDDRRREVRVAAGLRQACGFAPLNLMDASYPVGEPMHLIFCRNVLIYFDQETQAKVIGRLIERLSPDGYLFLGHSETISGMGLPLVAVANTVFQRS